MTKEELRRCQLKQLEALKFIDGICRENGLQYFAHTGTLLGAVRHHGYIPWDMDTDILMPKEDAKKLVELVDVMHWSDYTILRDVDGWGWCDRLVMHNVKAYGSAAITEEDQFMHLDIYAYDYAKKHSPMARKAYDIETNLIRRLIGYRYGRNMFRKPIFKVMTQLTGVRYRKYSNEELIHRVHRLAVSNVPTNEVTVYNSFYGFGKETYAKEWFDEVLEVPFEDMMIPVPKGYDQVLTALYGDWRVPPPPVWNGIPHIWTK